MPRSSVTSNPTEGMSSKEVRLRSCHFCRFQDWIFISVRVSAQSPDGDVIDCVPSHLQLAFDHPRLKGEKLPDLPERPKGNGVSGEVEVEVEVQRWRSSGEECPEGTIAVRRTMEKDILRASSIRSFGRKPAVIVRRDSTGSGHEVQGLQSEDLSVEFCSSLFCSLGRLSFVAGAAIVYDLLDAFCLCSVVLYVNYSIRCCFFL
ncbi:hypothetical protein MA16_Dca018344 [Dendrobium catenatum]|uniref:Neprosin activation peptide domain-containing protein n=1 Tax=Dendrobium catenatum TaxID=906689 RepID=A0A2I0VWQ1_9ASPA|nr:hypothetical protein MA16_Dca018344 [Dendrobium catenatum]